MKMDIIIISRGGKQTKLHNVDDAFIDWISDVLKDQVYIVQEVDAFVMIIMVF